MFIAFPDGVRRPARASFGLAPNVHEHRSPRTQRSQRIMLAGARWMVTMTWRRLFPAREQALLTAWLNQLHAQGGYTRIPHWGYERVGTPAGSPVVDGANPSGLTLPTRGWTANAVEVLSYGDFFELGTGILIQAAGTVDADGDGKADIPLVRPIGLDLSDGMALKFDEPAGLFHVPVGDGWSGDWSSPRAAGFAVELEEDLEAVVEANA